jgi:hypothetical protein
MTLALEKASIIVDKTLAKARELKFRPMCVAVLDDGGHLVASRLMCKFLWGVLTPVLVQVVKDCENYSL